MLKSVSFFLNIIHISLYFTLKNKAYSHQTYTHGSKIQPLLLLLLPLLQWPKQGFFLRLTTNNINVVYTAHLFLYSSLSLFILTIISPSPSSPYFLSSKSEFYSTFCHKIHLDTNSFHHSLRLQDMGSSCP